jgi:hypothetical protein
MPQFAGPPGAVAEHVPSVWPAATLQIFVQQSAPVEQESFGCPQKDEAWHVPFVQSFEQHSADPPQPLPSVLHIVVRGVHFPPVPQFWLQHSPLAVHV